MTAREKVYGKGQHGLRDDHEGAKYRYDVYREEESNAEKKAENGASTLPLRSDGEVGKA